MRKASGISVSTETNATLLVVTSGILWGLLSIFVRQLAAAGLTSMEIVFLRMTIALVGLLVFLLLRAPDQLRIRLRDLWLFFCTGIVSITLHNFCLFSAIQAGDSTVAVVLTYTAPAFVMLMSAAFFRERITARKLAALAATLIGCVCVSGLLDSQISITPQAFLLGIGSGFFYAAYSIFGSLALKKYDSFTVIFYSFLFASACASPFVDFPKVALVCLTQPVMLLYTIGIGVFCAAVPYIFYTIGLKRMEAGKASVLVSTDPLVASLVGIFVFHESVTAFRLLGITFILAAILILNPFRKKAPNHVLKSPR